MLSIKNLSYYYDPEFMIKDVSFDLSKGETLALVGPSGSGKTTVLKLILGAYQPDSGSILLDGEEISQWEIEKRYIGYCPQDQLLFPHLNVYDNIAIGLKAQKMSKQKIKELVSSLATKGEIYQYLKRKPNQLSGGQKQRVSILRALAPEPRLLLLDEPFHNLDAQIKDQVVSYIKKLQAEMNVTIIFVTHDIAEARLLADKIVILVDGQMKQFGTPKELSYNPNSYEVANSMGLPNIFRINSYNKETNSVETSFGRIFLKENQYFNQQTLLIDPSMVEIIPTTNLDTNLFKAIIKSKSFDVLSKTQIYNVQIINNWLQDTDSGEEEKLLQVVEKNSEEERDKDQKIMIEIPKESIKLL